MVYSYKCIDTNVKLLKFIWLKKGVFMFADIIFADDNLSLQQNVYL
jgi:hypothetical protein